MSENIKLQINVSTNLLNKYITPKQILVDVQTSEITKDEVIMNKKDDKTRGHKTLKTIIGFGCFGAIGCFIADFFETKKIPQIKKQLNNNLGSIYNELWNFKDSSAITEQGKQNYSKLTSTLLGINKYNGSDYKCFLFEGKDKKSADKIMDWIGNTCNKEYKTVDFFAPDFDLADILEEGKTLKDVRLFRAENMDKLIKKDTEQSVIAAMKGCMSDCGQKETNTILMFHAKDFNELDDIASAPHRISKHFKVDEMKDFDKYTKLYKEYQNIENKLSKISKTTKMKFIAIGIVTGLAIATGIFKILKINNTKGIQNENISN